MRLNKGDIILLLILLATVLLFGVNELNILGGYEQLTDAGWTIFGVIFGGELLTFALYRVGMQKYSDSSSQEIKDENRGRHAEQIDES